MGQISRKIAAYALVAIWIASAAGSGSTEQKTDGAALPPVVDPAPAARFGNWKVVEKENPIDGKKTFFLSVGTEKHAPLFISYSHKPVPIRDHRFHISYSLGRDFKCPYLEPDVPPGYVPHRYVFISWRIDDGPVHGQRYDCLGKRGSCNILGYLWRVFSVDRDGYIEQYRKLSNPFSPGSRYYDEHRNYYVIPADEMVSLLRKGRSIYLRGSDQCESVDVGIDLRGLNQAFLAMEAGTLKPSFRPEVGAEGRIQPPSSPLFIPVLPRWIVPNTVKPPPTLRSAASPQQIFKLVGQSVYIVLATLDTHNGAVSQGSAVAVSKHEAITNCHVVEGSKNITLSNGSTKIRALVSAADVPTDRCLLTIVGGQLIPIGGLRDYSDLAVGETVYTIGAPLGLDKTLGQGLISGLRQSKGLRLIQVSAPISRGSSGGGLFDDRGNLIGVTTFALRESQSLNFAIAASEYWR